MGNLMIAGLVGAFIGWNLPQPPWAKWLQAKAVAGVKSLVARFNKPPTDLFEQ